MPTAKVAYAKVCKIVTWSKFDLQVMEVIQPRHSKGFTVHDSNTGLSYVSHLHDYSMDSTTMDFMRGCSWDIWQPILQGHCVSRIKRIYIYLTTTGSRPHLNKTAPSARFQQIIIYR